MTTQLGIVVRRGERWIDAGCGSGVLTRELARFGAKGVGVDASCGMISAAINEDNSDTHRFDYRVIDTIEVIPEEDFSFDGVLCSSVVEYLAKPEDALLEFYRILKVGGTLIITVPNSFSFVRAIQCLIRCVMLMFGKKFFSYLSISKNAYSYGKIKTILGRHGFIVASIVGFDSILPTGALSDHFGSLFIVVAHKLHGL